MKHTVVIQSPCQDCHGTGEIRKERSLEAVWSELICDYFSLTDSLDLYDKIKEANSLNVAGRPSPELRLLMDVIKDLWPEVE